MQIGALTARFNASEWPLDRIITWAGENGIDCLEIATPAHLNPAEFLKEKGQAGLTKKLEAAGVTISSLASYSAQINDPDDSVRKAKHDAAIASIQVAESLGVDTVCLIAGFPAPGKDKMATIREDLPAIFEPILAEAQRRGIRIALENWYSTNIQHLGHWRALFEVLPQDNFGLNYDPSHLYWQEIDYLDAVKEFATRIFHTHAKDVAIDDAALRSLGVLDGGWWRYTIPGTGRIPWGEYIGKLREIGYDGVLSIEHEDRTLDACEGFLMGAAHLRPLIA